MPTIEQQIARKQDEINRLKTKQRKLETGQKVIIGGMMLSLANDSPEVAKFLIDKLEKNVTRATDKKRIAPLLEELKQKHNGYTSNP